MGNWILGQERPSLSKAGVAEQIVPVTLGNGATTSSFILGYLLQWVTDSAPLRLLRRLAL